MDHLTSPEDGVEDPNDRLRDPHKLAMATTNPEFDDDDDDDDDEEEEEEEEPENTGPFVLLTPDILQAIEDRIAEKEAAEKARKALEKERAGKERGRTPIFQSFPLSSFSFSSSADNR